MARTDIAAVKEILDTALTDSDILAHINIASRATDNKLSGKGLTEEVLTDIETFWTAHIIAMGKERQAKSEKIGDVQVQYQGEFGEGLRMTTYGQMVLMLDTTGTLANAGLKKARIWSISQNNC